MRLEQAASSQRYRAAVAAFDLNADTQHPADFALLRGGGLALYRSRAVLDEAEQELADAGYALIRLVASGLDKSGLHDAFAAGFAFPDHYGRNMNALADCLYDVAHGDYGWSTDATGLAVTLDGFGTFADRDRDTHGGRRDGWCYERRAAIRPPVALATTCRRLAVPPRTSWRLSSALEQSRVARRQPPIGAVPARAG